jgi:predicted DCC family thiol-disulfide oxidoreductase YuxK
MTSGWTGGQYSVYRIVFAGYLFIHFAKLLPWGPELFSNVGVLTDGSKSPLLHLFPNILALWDGPQFIYGFLTLAAVLSIAFAIGWHDRIAAVGLWYIIACLHGRMPLIINPGMPYVGWLLLAHACLPSAPYGSWAARGRTDPAGGWKMNDGIWTVAWILMAIGYSYSGLTKLNSPSWLDGSALHRVLESPLARPGWPRDLLLKFPTGILGLATWGALALEILFAPLALIRTVRPWLWLAIVFMHLALMLVIDFADLNFGMMILHFFTFDPAWIWPARPGVTETIFYDGDCGLCHRAVRFVLAEDRLGTTFRFAPLASDAFREKVSEAQRQSLPDSIVVQTHQQELLMKSTAVFYIMQRLGGLWRIIAIICGLIPRPIRDGLYDRIAAVRKKIFAAPPAACPILPKELRGRFDY